jgi:hypothetical protein
MESITYSHKKRNCWDFAISSPIISVLLWLPGRHRRAAEAQLEEFFEL